MGDSQKGKKFGRKKDQRRALLRSLASSLILEERIKTTESRAKATSKFVEKFITKAKTEDLSSRRELARIFSKEVAHKLIEEIAPRYKERKGGYTRVIKLAPRKSDGASRAILELV